MKQDAILVIFIGSYDADSVNNAIASGGAAINEGIETAFELTREVNEKVDSGCWLSGCFAFTTGRLRIQTITASVVDTIAFLDRPSWILGYLPETNRLVSNDLVF